MTTAMIVLGFPNKVEFYQFVMRRWAVLNGHSVEVGLILHMIANSRARIEYVEVRQSCELGGDSVQN